MKHALIALVILIGLGAQGVQATNPYLDMIAGAVGVKAHNSSLQRQLAETGHLLCLATIGNSPDTRGFPDLRDTKIALNICEERPDVMERITNVRAIAIAAYVTCQEPIPFSVFFDAQKGRKGIQPFEHDHIYMASIIFQTARNYFQVIKTPRAKDRVNEFLRKFDIAAFRAKDLFTSNDDLVEFLNDFSGFTPASSAGATGFIDSLATLFDLVAVEYPYPAVAKFEKPVRSPAPAPHMNGVASPATAAATVSPAKAAVARVPVTPTGVGGTGSTVSPAPNANGPAALLTPPLKAPPPSAAPSPAGGDGSTAGKSPSVIASPPGAVASPNDPATAAAAAAAAAAASPNATKPAASAKKVSKGAMHWAKKRWSSVFGSKAPTSAPTAATTSPAPATAVAGGTAAAPSDGTAPNAAADGAGANTAAVAATKPADPPAAAKK